MKAYKVFNPDWTCREFKFEIGKTYKHEGDVQLCGSGFHACEKVNQCFSYYSFDTSNKIAEVELSGEIIKGDDKCVAAEIKIIREVSWQEMLVLANTGYGNSGHSNSGDRNSGDRNSGHSNSGDSNSGDRNSGDWNSGDWNSGDRNSGFFNSITPQEILVFNKPCNRDIWKNTNKPSFIYDITATKWVDKSNMTIPEKNSNPNWETLGGYLKVFTYKEAWHNAYEKASDEDIELLKALPNFDAEVFKEITGIEIK